MLQFGWKAGTEQYPPAELLEYAILAEAAGFDSISVSGSFSSLERRGPGLFRVELARRGCGENKQNRFGYRSHLPHTTISSRRDRAGCRHFSLSWIKSLLFSRCGNRRSFERIFGYRPIACLQIPPGPNGGSHRADSSPVDRGENNPQRHVLPDSPGKTLYTAARSNFALHLDDGAEQRPFCRKIWRWVDHSRRRRSRDVSGNFCQLRSWRPRSRQESEPNAAHGRTRRCLYRR